MLGQLSVFWFYRSTSRPAFRASEQGASTCPNDRGYTQSHIATYSCIQSHTGMPSNELADYVCTVIGAGLAPQLELTHVLSMSISDSPLHVWVTHKADLSTW